MKPDPHRDFLRQLELLAWLDRIFTYVTPVGAVAVALTAIYVVFL